MLWHFCLPNPFTIKHLLSTLSTPINYSVFRFHPLVENLFVTALLKYNESNDEYILWYIQEYHVLIIQSISCTNGSCDYDIVVLVLQSSMVLLLHNCVCSIVALLFVSLCVSISINSSEANRPVNFCVVWYTHSTQHSL